MSSARIQREAPARSGLTRTRIRARVHSTLIVIVSVKSNVPVMAESSARCDGIQDEERSNDATTLTCRTSAALEKARMRAEDAGIIIR